MKFIIILVVVLIVAALFFYLYLSLKGIPFTPTPAAKPTAPQPETLGGKIYDQTKNPIQGKVPTLNPVANPVQGLYKNPFR